MTVCMNFIVLNQQCQSAFLKFDNPYFDICMNFITLSQNVIFAIRFLENVTKTDRLSL